ncbi:MAG: RNA polymerase sigma factor [Rubripirellula sp.]
MEPPADRNAFETTHWSMIQAAGDADRSGYGDAMSALCQRYWFPLYAFARSRGHDADQAQDLIQAFFVRVLEKDVIGEATRERGRFRNFLLAALKNFARNEYAASKALKRGGAQTFSSLDFRDAEGRLAHEVVDHLTAEAVFHQHWAMEVLQRTLTKLQEEYRGQGKETLFDELSRYLNGDKGRAPYAEVAVRLQMTTDAVKVNVHRLRRRYRWHLESEIVDTLAAPGDVESEIHDLFEALRNANRS